MGCNVRGFFYLFHMVNTQNERPFLKSGIFDLFNVMRKECHKTALNPFLNGTKICDVDGTCKHSLPSQTGRTR